jgi:hypothetical protein
MRKMWIAATLLATVTAVPALAQERDHDGRGGGGQHQDGGGQRGGGGGFRGGGNPGGGQPSQQHFQPPSQQQAQQARPGGGDRHGNWSTLTGDPNRVRIGPGGNVQLVRPQPGAPPAGNAPGPGDWNGHRPGDGGHGGWNGGRPDNRPDGRPDWNGQRPDQRHGWNGGRPDNRPDWQNGRPGNRPDGNGNRPGNGWNGNRGGGDWNRGWRQDRRYDWQGWRARHRDVYRIDRYRPPYGFGWGYRSFGVGYQMDPAFYAEDYWIDNPAYYRLPPAYGPYRWVRYYNDALLIDINDGEVVDSIPNFFY